MTKIFSFKPIVFIALILIIGCSDLDQTANNKGSEAAKKELDDAFKKMWKNVTLTNAAEYFKTDVSDNFFTINADGIVQKKEELLADTKRLEMLEILDFKFFDQQIKVYDNVGIINGRIQAFSDETYAGEIFYTAIFVKENDTWKYENWQGTWTADSPPPPSFVAANDNEKILEFGQNYTAAWNSHQPESMASFYAEDGSLSVNNGKPAISRNQIAETAQSYMEAFPDLELTMDSLTVQENTYRYYWTFKGTNTGPGGTGNKVDFSGFEEWTMNEQGLVQKSVGTYDAEVYQRQLQGN